MGNWIKLRLIILCLGLGLIMPSFLEAQPVNLKDTKAGLRKSTCDTSIYYSPITFGFSDSLYCPGDSIDVVLKVIPYLYPDHSFIWNPGTSNELVASDSFEIRQQGYYFVAAMPTDTTCPILYSDTVHVGYMPQPVLNFPDTITACLVSGPQELNAYNEGSSYLWQDGTKNAVYPFKFKGDSTQNIICVVSNRCYPSISDTSFLYILPPYAYLLGDSIACPGDSLTFDGAQFNASVAKDLKYVWILNKDTVQQGIIPNGGDASLGKYHCSAQDSGTLKLVVSFIVLDSTCGWAQDSMNIDYYRYLAPAFEPLKDTIICYNENQTFRPIILPNGAYDSTAIDSTQKYAWYLGIKELDTNLNYSPSDTGYYIFKANNLCGHSYDTVLLTYYPAEWIAQMLPSDTTICIGANLDLDASVENTTTRYIWEDQFKPEDTAGGKKPDQGGKRTFEHAGNYQITLIDTVNCVNTYTVSLAETDCSPKLEIPNVITPNGDGINDDLQLKTKERIYNFEIRIFDRWGHDVYRFKGNPDDFLWGGYMGKSSKIVPTGAYFYLALYTDFKGKKFKQTGSITVLK